MHVQRSVHNGNNVQGTTTKLGGWVLEMLKLEEKAQCLERRVAELSTQALQIDTMGPVLNPQVGGPLIGLQKYVAWPTVRNTVKSGYLYC